MPEQDQIVINTGPIIALIAALGDLSILKSLYGRIIVPKEVGVEVLAGGGAGFGVQRDQEQDSAFPNSRRGTYQRGRHGCRVSIRAGIPREACFMPRKVFQACRQLQPPIVSERNS